MEARKTETDVQDVVTKEVKAKATKEPKEPKAAKEQAVDLHEYVPIKLFKDNGRYKEPLPVAVNDYSALIPRGSVQYVPLFVKLHIEEMQAQDENTARLIEGIVEEAETKFKTAGI